MAVTYRGTAADALQSNDSELIIASRPEMYIPQVVRMQKSDDDDLTELASADRQLRNQDILESLRWLKRNAAAFGGDI